tara:strand:+ start:278 stop:766 length:489 start_codon:yes stop_codon:yes gene_type:complete
MLRTGFKLSLLFSLIATFSSAEVIFNEAYDDFAEVDNSSVLLLPVSDLEITLGWKCFDDGLNVLLLHKYLGGDTDGDVVIRYKFDSEPASDRNWYALSGNHEVTFFDMGDVAYFTNKALASQQIMIRLTDPVDDEILQSTFNPSDLEPALQRLTSRNPGCDY